MLSLIYVLDPLFVVTLAGGEVFSATTELSHKTCPVCKRDCGVCTLPKITMAQEDSGWTRETQSRRSLTQRPGWLQRRAGGSPGRCPPGDPRSLHRAGRFPSTEVNFTLWTRTKWRRCHLDARCCGNRQLLWVSRGLDVAILPRTPCQLLWGLWELINLVDLRLTVLSVQPQLMSSGHFKQHAFANGLPRDD